jgi:hypothetical protein
LETQRDAEAHCHNWLKTVNAGQGKKVLTMACRIAQWGKPGFLGGNLIEARKSGLWKIREPQGSHLKKTSMLRNNKFQRR